MLRCRKFLTMVATNLRKILSGTAVGVIAVMAVNVMLSFGVTVLLARILGPEEFGRYSFVYVAVLIFSIPLTYGLRTLLVREIAILSDHNEWAQLNGLLRGGVAAWALYSFAVLVLFALARFLFPGDWFGLPSRLYEIALILLPLISAIAGLSAVMAGLQHVVLGQASNLILRPVLFVLFTIIAWKVDFFTLGAYAATALNVFAAICGVLLSLWLALYVLPKATLASKPSYRVRAWLSSVAPLTVNAAVGIIYTYTDILMLGVIDTSESVGQYRVATQGAVFTLLAMQALTPLVNPKIAMQYARGERFSLESSLVRFSLLTLIPAVAVFLVYLTFGKELLLFVFGESYVGVWAALVILCFGQVVNVATGFVGPILNMTGHEKETVIATTASAVINLVLNLLLIPALGTIGAAAATCISVIFWNVYLCWRVFRVTGLKSSPLSHVGALVWARE